MEYLRKRWRMDWPVPSHCSPPQHRIQDLYLQFEYELVRANYRGVDINSTPCQLFFKECVHQKNVEAQFVDALFVHMHLHWECLGWISTNTSMHQGKACLMAVWICVPVYTCIKECFVIWVQVPIHTCIKECLVGFSQVKVWADRKWTIKPVVIFIDGTFSA